MFCRYYYVVFKSEEYHYGFEEINRYGYFFNNYLKLSKLECNCTLVSLCPPDVCMYVYTVLMYWYSIYRPTYVLCVQGTTDLCVTNYMID